MIVSVMASVLDVAGTCIYTVNLLHMCPSALFSSNVVPVAAEWDWSERLPGMGCKYASSLKVEALSMVYGKYYLQGIATSAKLNDITNGVVQDINQHCQCGLSTEGITEQAFQCFENSEQQVTFRARLRGTGQASSSQLVAHLQTFVAQADSTIAVQGVRLDVDGSWMYP